MEAKHGYAAFRGANAEGKASQQASLPVNMAPQEDFGLFEGGRNPR
jgi:hypothetical protein